MLLPGDGETIIGEIIQVACAAKSNAFHPRAGTDCTGICAAKSNAFVPRAGSNCTGKVALCTWSNAANVHLLRASYAISGTDIRCAATTPLCCYPPARRCPVLTYAVLLPQAFVEDGDFDEDVEVRLHFSARRQCHFWRHRGHLWMQYCCLWRHAAVYGCSAAVYGGSAAVYGGSTAVYGCSAAVYGGSAAVQAWRPATDGDDAAKCDLHAAVYGANSAIYGANSAIGGASAAIYGASAAMCDAHAVPLMAETLLACTRMAPNLLFPVPTLLLSAPVQLFMVTRPLG
eukprot:3505316-Rhodomonas_salina.2